MQTQQIEQVFQELQTLTPEQVNKVENFIDFLKQRDDEHQLTRAAMSTSETSLSTVWNNPDDIKYDQL